MKKFIYLLLIPLCMGFVACGDDDVIVDPPPTKIETTNPLVGTWENVERESGYYRGYKWENKWTYTFTFQNDGKFEYNILYVYTSEDEREPDDSSTSNEKGKYAYDSNTRTLSLVADDGKTRSFTILTLTESILTLLLNDGEKWTFSKKN